MNKIKGFFKSINTKSLKYGSISAVLTIVVIALVIIVNLIVNSMATNNVLPMKWDLSANQIYSLDNKSIDILKALNKDIEIYALYSESEAQKSSVILQVKEVLQQYEKYSTHIKVIYVDPDLEPGITSKLDPTGTNGLSKGNFVVISGKKTRVLTNDDITVAVYDENTGEQTDARFVGEQSFTGAIKYVISDFTPVIYFLSGHGEGGLDTNYTIIKKQLQANNYDVKSVNLIVTKKIPSDAKILMIPGPKADLTPAEKASISEFLNNGGKAVFMFDYLESKVKFPEFESLLTSYNIGIDYDKVKENDSSMTAQGDPFSFLLNIPANDVITVPSQMVLSNSRSIGILSNAKSTLTVTSLVKTSDKAVGIQIDKSNGNNINGPLNLAVAAENKGTEKASKVIVMGNAYFISDEAANQSGQYYQYGNDFFTQAMNWMIDQTDSVVIDSKSYLPTALTISDAQVQLIGILTVLVFPLLILGTGLFVWLRRRHL
ncbi:MAG: GldG family protein [Clostridia bacterium]|jgi:hypothetical protein